MVACSRLTFDKLGHPEHTRRPNMQLTIACRRNRVQQTFTGVFYLFDSWSRCSPPCSDTCTGRSGSHRPRRSDTGRSRTRLSLQAESKTTSVCVLLERRECTVKTPKFDLAHFETPQNQNRTIFCLHPRAQRKMTNSKKSAEKN